MIKLQSDEFDPNIKKNFYKLIFYPSILIVCWSMLIFVRISELANPSKSYSYLNLVDYSLANLDGAFNTLLYIYIYIRNSH